MLSLSYNKRTREIISLYRGHNNNLIHFKNQSELINKIYKIGNMNIDISKNSKNEYKVNFMT